MRSKLFVPASRTELFGKALSGAADALSFDLEDAVEEGQKARARAALKEALQSPAFSTSAKIIIVRVNAWNTHHCREDVRAVLEPRLDMINLPMVDDPQQLVELCEWLQVLEAERGQPRQVRVLANIESPRGLRLAAQIACAHPRVCGLQIGYGDLFGPMGADPTDHEFSQWVRMQVRVAAAEAGVAAYDGAYTNVRDLEGYERSARAAARLGFAGKSCIHPTQVEAANRCFQPSEQAVAHARRVVAEAQRQLEAGVGAFTVDGQLIDGPLIDRARELVARVDRDGGGS